MATKKSATARVRATEEGPREFTYTLAELPSSQHRAGLAGLVGMVDWLQRQSLARRGICSIEHIDTFGLTLLIDRQGMRDLFDQVYAASRVEQGYSAPFKGKDPIRIEEVALVAKPKLPARAAERMKKRTDMLVAATPTPKTKKVYVYPITIPRGAYLVEADAGADEAGNGPWIKLWRDMVWSILRGVPSTRAPFAEREAGPGVWTKDADDTWSRLKDGEAPVDLPSTYFLGVQASTAENVDFKDKARFQFLLHFWPFMAQIYVPTSVDRDGTSAHHGFCIAVPDVSNLDLFCAEIFFAFRDRSNEVAGFRPRGSLVHVASESALELFSRIKRCIQQRQPYAVSDLMLGADVFHVAKDGNNVRVLGVGRVEPDETLIDEYQMVQGVYWSPLFRRQRLINLVARKRWYAGFDRLLSTTPWTQTFAHQQFKHDANEAFMREAHMSSEAELDDSDSPTLDAVIYKMVNIYIGRKIRSKHGMEYEHAKSSGKLEEYGRYREKIAKDAFLSARSRTGSDFVEFFASTLCSVPQHIKESEYLLISKALLDPASVEERVRPLTMLALSARG